MQETHHPCSGGRLDCRAAHSFAVYGLMKHAFLVCTDDGGFEAMNVRLMTWCSLMIAPSRYQLISGLPAGASRRVLGMPRNW